jgi:hypothetical protein
LMLLKSRASPDMLPFSVCNKKRLAIQHTNRPLFPMTLSITSYDIGKWVGLRTYQHPLVIFQLHVSVNIHKLFLCRVLGEGIEPNPRALCCNQNAWQVPWLWCLGVDYLCVPEHWWWKIGSCSRVQNPELWPWGESLCPAVFKVWF